MATRTVESRLSQGASRLGIPYEEYRRRRAAGLRYCSGHRAWHLGGPLTFARDRRRADGLAANCKVWHREYQRARRQRQRAELAR